MIKIHRLIVLPISYDGAEMMFDVTSGTMELFKSAWVTDCDNYDVIGRLKVFMEDLFVDCDLSCRCGESIIPIRNGISEILLHVITVNTGASMLLPLPVRIIEFYAGDMESMIAKLKRNVPELNYCIYYGVLLEIAKILSGEIESP